MRGPHFGMIPRRVPKLRLPGRVHAVLDVIACHANPKKGNRAYLRRDTIANEAGIDCSKVSFCTSWLEKNGLLEISGRGGRGLANTYRIIPDAEAVTPAAATTAAENGADDGTVSNQHGAENGAVFGQNGADFGQNGAKNGTPTESEQEERTKPPSGESRASAREGGKIFPMLGLIEARWRCCRRPTVVAASEWCASERSSKATIRRPGWSMRRPSSGSMPSTRMSSAIMAWHLKNGKVPADPDQAYYYWITDPRFPKRRSNAAEAEVNAAFDDALSQMRAHGAGARQ